MGFPSGGKVHEWSLAHDPDGADGRGVVTAVIDGAKAICILDEGHKQDGARFDRFGILNVVKSADSGGEVYLDDITVNGELETFDEDPRWDAKGNQGSHASRVVRPRFDLGFRPTQLAGGCAPGELGGTIFRGDCREEDRMACYGAPVGPLSLERPFRASGKLSMTRGVSDSTTLFGFYHSTDSMRRNDSQNDAVPESVTGIHLEGPSREGFRVYPVLRLRGGGSRSASAADNPHILPDGTSHDWSLVYDPAEAGGRGRLTVTFDGQSVTLDLADGERSAATRFDRFGIVSSWVDGNSQDVFWDDVTYTVAQVCLTHYGPRSRKRRSNRAL